MNPIVPIDSPGLLSLAPAVVAITLAVVTRQVLVALFGAVVVGAALLGEPVRALFGAMDIVVEVAADKDKQSILFFTMMIGAMVGIVERNGGTRGVVTVVARFATSAQRTQFATWVMGLVVFFDDYASTLLVGTTMRPLSDAARISREKLSYIVDSTAAPVASLALVSTWIGYEVSVMQEALENAGIARAGYDVFVSGLSMRFYPIYALVVVLIVAVTGRDFGPMLKAERRARQTGKVLRDGANPLLDAAITEDATRINTVVPRPWLAILPIGTLVVSVVVGLSLLGSDASYAVLLYSVTIAILVAVTSTVATRALSLHGVVDAGVAGIRAIALAVVVLILAWSIGKVMSDLHAGAYVASLLSQTLPAWLIPTSTFLLASAMAFATGTSWGTMAVLFPIIIPVVAQHQGVADFDGLLVSSCSAVLAGAVFGDHCSPISDTTVLSSISSSADLIDHTRTQMPYAVLCAIVSVLIGTVPVALGVPGALCLIVGVVVLVFVFRFFGERVDDLPSAP